MQSLAVAIGIALIAIVGAYFAGRWRGAAKEREKVWRRSAENALEAQEIDESVARMSDEDLADRLRRHQR